MKKLLLILSFLVIGSLSFALSLTVNVKGEAYVKSSDGDVYILKEGDNSVEKDDTVIVGERTTIAIYVDGSKIVVRAPGAYKISELLK